MLATLAVVLLERARYARCIVQRSLRSQAPQMAAICQQPNSRTRWRPGARGQSSASADLVCAQSCPTAGSVCCSALAHHIWCPLRLSATLTGPEAAPSVAGPLRMISRQPRLVGRLAGGQFAA